MNMSSLLDVYYDFLKIMNYEARKGIEETLKYLENGHDVILKAPTGYGKTTLTAILANAVGLGYTDLADRVIHVLPYRAIVQDLYENLRRYVEKKAIKISKKEIGAQDMDFYDSPFFVKKVNITTLDTFVFNLFKFPTAEFKMAFQKHQSHFEFPRAMIYSSIVLFDEFHLLGEEGKPLSTGIASLKALKEAGVPVVIMSATIDNNLEGLLKKYLDDVKVVNATDYKIERRLTVNFLNSEDEIINVAENKLKEGRRVLIVSNTRVNAIDIYSKLKDRNLSALLIHSKFNREDRKRKVEKITCKDESKCEKAKLVVSTQVIEAGIDTTFDVLITEATVSHNLIQRTGRIARYGGEGEVYIYPFSKKSEGIYDKEEVQKTIDRVKSEKTINEKILLEKKYDIDENYVHDLSVIDGYIFIYTVSTAKIYEKICSLTRDDGLILGFPPGRDDPKYAVPLTEDEAVKIIKEKKGEAFVCTSECWKENIHINEKRLKNNNKKNNYCLEFKFLKYNIDGVRLTGYNSDTGAEL